MHSAHVWALLGANRYNGRLTVGIWAWAYILPPGELSSAVLITQNVSFFKSLNAIFCKVGRFAYEQVVLNLLRAKCLPVLLYGVESFHLLVRDKRSLEFTVTAHLWSYFGPDRPPLLIRAFVRRTMSASELNLRRRWVQKKLFCFLPLHTR